MQSNLLNREQIQLLRASFFSGKDALEAWNAWKAMIDFDQIDFASYKLLPLVSRNPALESLNDPVFEKCKGVYRRNWVENRLSWAKLFPVLARLNQIGIDQIVLLKGMAMILHYYRDFGVRVIGDVDILIRREHLSIATSFLRSSGWEANVSRLDIENQEHLKKWHALNFTHPSGLRLDLHWSFIQENSPSLDERVLKDSIPLEMGWLYVPNSTDLLLQTCVHGLKYSPVPLIRWMADAMVLLKDVDWERLICLAQLAHVCRPLLFGMEYLSSQFDTPIPPEIIHKLKSHPSTRLESLEYKFHSKRFSELASWCRYCLNQGYLTKTAQILHLHQYLQLTARLKSPWLIFPFSIYWIFKRIYRKISKSCYGKNTAPF